MKNYIELLTDALNNGTHKVDRTGVGSRSVFGRMLKYNLTDGFPMVTTRKVALRPAFEETMFFLRGETNTKLLEEKNVNIWKGNTTREFLDSRNLHHLPEGDMGKGYGHMIRKWESPVYDEKLQKHIVKRTDQISNLINDIQNDPYSRRHIVTHWNPGQLNEAALPPCHVMHMYSVEGEFSIDNGKLNSCFIMRSSDLYLGLPTNLMSYALINMAFSKILGLQPGELTYFGWDAHLYDNQIETVKQQIQREPKNLPQLNFKKDFKSLDEFLELQYEDIELIGYDPHPAFPKIDMAV